MRFRPAILACLLALGALVPATAAHAAPGEWVVTYARAGAVDAETDARERARGFRARLRFRHAVRGFAARLTPGQVAALRADPDVASVAPDRPRRVAGTPVATGDTVPPGVVRVGAGTPVVARGAATSAVAIVDTGIDLDHPDLDVGAGVDCTGAGSADDADGHGTHVAGTVAARNGAGGVVGVAPGTRVHPVRVLDADGVGSDSTVICGLDWIVANATALNVRVANLSLGGAGVPSRCGDWSDPLHEAVCRTVRRGVSVVVAAGNDARDFGGTLVDTPAWYPEVLTVTAMGDGDGLPGGLGILCRAGESDDAWASFSNFARLAEDAAHTVAAPGVCVRSTYPGGGYARMSGTSMASPHVAGLVALCLGESGSSGPCAGMTPPQVVARVRADAEAATAQGFGFDGDPASPHDGRAYGHLARAVPDPAVSDPGAAPAPGAQPAASEPVSAPVAVAAPAAVEAATPPSTETAAPAPAAAAPSCRVHVHVRRHVHRRRHLHRRDGIVARRHVHRRAHFHRPSHRHCG